MRSPESAPRTSQPEQAKDNLEDIFKLDSVQGGDYEPPFVEEGNNKEDSAPESSNESAPADKADRYSKTATVLRNSTERVAALLEKWSEGVPARQEARAETAEKAKETVKRVGSQALSGAKAMGTYTLGMSILSVELTIDSGVNARNKVMSIAMEARKRFDERRAYREEKRRNLQTQNEAFASYEPNVQYSQDKIDQDNAFASYEPNVEYSEDHAEAVEMNKEKKASQAAAYDSYSDNIDATQRREDQEAAFESYEENISISERLERKRLALIRREARQARRREIYGNIRETGSDVYAAAKKHGKRFGRAALKLLKRTASAGKAAAKAAVNAGTQAWAESK